MICWVLNREDRVSEFIMLIIKNTNKKKSKCESVRDCIHCNGIGACYLNKRPITMCFTKKKKREKKEGTLIFVSAAPGEVGVRMGMETRDRRQSYEIVEEKDEPKWISLLSQGTTNVG